MVAGIQIQASQSSFPAIPPENPRYWAACQRLLHRSLGFVATLPLELRYSIYLI